MTIQQELPKKVFQDDFRPGRGNALQAAVASIFGLELANVPNFVELPEGYESAIQSFCCDRDRDRDDRTTTSMVKIKLTTAAAAAAGEEEIEDEDKDEDDHNHQYGGKLCVLRGKSPRGDFGHVVVARRNKVGDGFEMIHDPHPDETFLDESEKFGWCMFFVPTA